MPSSRIILLTSVLLLFTLEYLYPYYPQRKNRTARIAMNVSLYTVNWLIGWAIFWSLLQDEFNWVQQHSVGLLHLVALPGWAEAALAFVLFDLWVYAMHRAYHSIPFLWRFHRVHHAEHEIDVFSLVRVHPAEQLVCLLGQAVAIPLLGMSLPQLACYTLFVQLAGFAYHSNIALPERWDRRLRFFLVTQHLHRIHHQPGLAYSKSNYASFFSVWDRLFGSYQVHHHTDAQPALPSAAPLALTP